MPLSFDFSSLAVLRPSRPASHTHSHIASTSARGPKPNLGMTFVFTFLHCAYLTIPHYPYVLKNPTVQIRSPTAHLHACTKRNQISRSLAFCSPQNHISQQSASLCRGGFGRVLPHLAAADYVRLPCVTPRYLTVSFHLGFLQITVGLPPFVPIFEATDSCSQTRSKLVDFH